jgi:hypothetical protein
MTARPSDTAEHRRLRDPERWQRWGTYLSDRAWGTVREDYSADGTAWDYLPHDHARSWAYRWNEEGLAGFCDRDHGDTGAGLGASHQTGWTALVALLLQRRGAAREAEV